MEQINHILKDRFSLQGLGKSDGGRGKRREGGLEWNIIRARRNLFFFVVLLKEIFSHRTRATLVVVRRSSFVSALFRSRVTRKRRSGSSVYYRTAATGVRVHRDPRHSTAHLRVPLRLRLRMHALYPRASHRWKDNRVFNSSFSRPPLTPSFIYALS